jgi:hypothetical protein
MAMAQKKNKKKAKTTISSKKKKQSIKKTVSKKNKTNSKKKKIVQKRPTVGTYIIPESKIAKTINQIVPITNLPLRNFVIVCVPE